jgi:site-specific recombinase XerC
VIFLVLQCTFSCLVLAELFSNLDPRHLDLNEAPIYFQGHRKRNRKLPSSNESREKLRELGVNLNPRDEIPQPDETVDDDKLS